MQQRFGCNGFSKGHEKQRTSIYNDVHTVVVESGLFNRGSERQAKPLPVSSRGSRARDRHISKLELDFHLSLHPALGREVMRDKVKAIEDMSAKGSYKWRV